MQTTPTIQESLGNFFRKFDGERYRKELARRILNGKSEFVVELTDLNEWSAELHEWLNEDYPAYDEVRKQVRLSVADLVRADFPDANGRMDIKLRGAPALVNMASAGYKDFCSACGRNSEWITVMEFWQAHDGSTFIIVKDGDSDGHERYPPRTFHTNTQRRDVFMNFLRENYKEKTIPILLRKFSGYFNHIGQIEEEEEFEEVGLAEARALAKNPRLLKVVLDDISKGHRGDDATKLTAFVLFQSARLEGHEQSVIIEKSSGAGGSDLLNKCLAYFDNVKSLTRMTAAAPDRSGLDFRGKILKVEEMKGAESASVTLRVMLSEGGTKLLTTAKDENGNITTVELETKGTPSFATTTADFNVEEQFLNRLWILTVDETKEQTREVVKYQFAKFDWGYVPFTPDTRIKCLVSSKSGLLDPKLKILMPYQSRLAEKFPCDTVTARRDAAKFANLIVLNAWLHQHQRPIVEIDGQRILIATLTDLGQVLNYAPDSILSTLRKVNNRTLAALQALQANRESMTYSEIAKALGTSSETARRIVQALDTQGYVDIDTSSKAHTVRARQSEAPDLHIDDLRSVTTLFSLKDAQDWLRRISSTLHSETGFAQLAERIVACGGEEMPISTEQAPPVRPAPNKPTITEYGGECAVCRKPGGLPHVRDKGVVNLHPQCEADWEGNL